MQEAIKKGDKKKFMKAVNLTFELIRDECKENHLRTGLQMTCALVLFMRDYIIAGEKK